MAGSPESQDQRFSPGPLAFGKYQLFAKLGSGGMAEVYLALLRGPMGFNKLVVLKRMRAPLADHAPMLTMFLDEARLAARLTHPNIVHTYEVGEHEGAYFIAMEYLEGQSLNKVLRAPQCREMISPVMWARVVADALRGLHHAHQLADYDGTPLGIVHRDISPHNIFLTYSGEVKIVDFGIAKAAVNATHTETGVLKGKISYMSPEQMRGEPDCRSDLFAMGVTLWELLVGRKLFKGDSVHVLNAVLNEPIPSARSVRPGLDPALDEIVAKALEKDVEDRYQSADEMREALEAYVRGTGEVMREATIGRAVTLMFHETKDKVHRQVQSHMVGISSAQSAAREIATMELSGSLPTLPEIGESQSTPSDLDIHAGRLIVQGSGTPPPPDPTSGYPGPPKDPQPPRRRGWVPMAVGAALLLFVVVGVAGLRVIATKPDPVVVSVQLPPPQTVALPTEIPKEDSVVEPAIPVAPVASVAPVALAATPAAVPEKLPAAVRTKGGVVRSPRGTAPLVAAAAHPPTPAPVPIPIKVKILEDEDPKKKINVIQE